MGHVTRLFPRGSLPGEFGIAAALGPAAPRDPCTADAAMRTQRSNTDRSVHRCSAAISSTTSAATGGNDACLDHQIVEQAELLDQQALGIAQRPVRPGDGTSAAAKFERALREPDRRRRIAEHGPAQRSA